jgi:hypothetical protein
MPTPQKPKKPVEVKILQRRDGCDLNVMLLYAFFVIKFDSDNTDFVDNKEFDREFISRCFYCGCVSGKSGVGISYFVIQKASFAALARLIKQDFPHERESYHNAIVRELLEILLEILRDDDKKPEQILIYDEKYRFITLSRKPVSAKSINKFIKSFPYPLEAERLAKQSDNLSELYNKIKEKLDKDRDKNIKIYYTLYDNTLPVISRGIGGKFIFCTKDDRGYAGCIARSYIKRTKLPQDGRLKDLYDFVGLGM